MRTLPDDRVVADAADIFALLGDPSRLRLVLALVDGELNVSDIASVTGQSESGVSHALRLLRAHRVVSVTRRGRMAFYRLDDTHVRDLLELGVTHIGDAS